MNSKRKHFRMACLASVVMLLGACSNSGEIKPDKMEGSVKPSQVKVVAPVVSPVKSVEVVKAPTIKVKPKAKAPIIKAKAKPKDYSPPKRYVPPKPIVVSVNKRPAVKKTVTNKPVVLRPPTVAAKKKVLPATVSRAASRSVYVAPKKTQTSAARVRQVAYRPTPKRRAPQVNYNQSRLTGDFAGNHLAEAFIGKMASQHGFSRSYVTGVLSQAKATAWLKKKAYADANPNPKRRGLTPSWSRYRSRFLTSKHINTGTAFYKKYSRTLERAASQYGVPSEYILGIMGVETIYGGNVGTDRALDALATMSFMNSRRGRYFTSELEAYLLMTRRVGLNPTQPKASYAGALGLPQFMPSNIKKYGVDYDGDGSVNLWTPHDAIGSIANYLSKHGWKRGEIAAIPAKRTSGRGYSSLDWGFKHKYSLSTLARKGLAPQYPGVSGNVHMLKLKTNNGYEYWIGGNNFYTITRYNHSSFYAMAVHELAQEIRSKVKPGRRALPRVINAASDRNLLLQAANSLL